ncbi:MAG: AMP-binding protein [Acidobacteriia bacterium]|nr:AMP-binding protein [Terriglobia bacterium]
MAEASIGEILWRPTGEQLAAANVRRFMKRQGIADYRELQRRSVGDIEWFWDAALKDLGVEWYQPYTRVLDDSAGFPWCRWFLSGKINIVHNCLDRHVLARPGATAVLWEGDGGETRRFTYSELAGEVARAAAALRGVGVGRGDVVTFFMPMVPELIIAFFAVLKLGAVGVPVFSAFGPDALSFRLQDAGAKVLFTADGSFRRGQRIRIKEVADRALQSAPSVRTVVVLRRTGDEIPWTSGRDVSWDDFVLGSGEPIATVPTDSEDRCLVVYTSGTTGRPKGAVHTHGGALAQIAKELGYYFDVKPDDRFFWLTDMGWMMGPWAVIGTMFFGATCMVFEGAPNWPRPDRLWDLVDRHQLTHLGISPTAIRLLSRAGDAWIERHDLQCLRILGSTGEPWDPESYAWFFQKAGRARCPVINISGGTEIMGCLLACAPVAPLKPCSFHGPGLAMDVDVVDDNARPVRGARGYLVLKQPAPSMTRGFLNDTQRYLDTYFSRWPGLWNHGDWARIDEAGFWYIEGRADDTIKVAGRRTGPAEIEAALMSHPSVSEAAAIGVPDDLTGEAIVCFVVTSPGAAAGDELAARLANQVGGALGRTLRPSRIHFVPSLPKTRSAKIVRGAIKRRYLGLPLGDITSVENTEALDSIPEAPRDQ